MKILCDRDYKLTEGRSYVGRHMRYTYESGKVEGKVWINGCVLKDKGAGPLDFWNVYLHEKAHANGWEHGEGTPEKNAAYYEKVKITGE